MRESASDNSEYEYEMVSDQVRKIFLEALNDPSAKKLLNTNQLERRDICARSHLSRFKSGKGKFRVQKCLKLLNYMLQSLTIRESLSAESEAQAKKIVKTYGKLVYKKSKAKTTKELEEFLIKNGKTYIDVFRDLVLLEVMNEADIIKHHSIRGLDAIKHMVLEGYVSKEKNLFGTYSREMQWSGQLIGASSKAIIDNMPLSGYFEESSLEYGLRSISFLGSDEARKKIDKILQVASAKIENIVNAELEKKLPKNNARLIDIILGKNIRKL